MVTLDRPEKRNAIDADLIAELHEVCAELEARPAAAVAHRRRGRHLRRWRRHRPAARAGSAGRPRRDQLGRLRPDPGAADADRGRRRRPGAGRRRGAGVRLRSAGVHGAGGLRPAGGAVGHPRRRRARPTGCPALIGEGRAKELLFTGRRVDAAEALRIGLVNRVVDEPDELLPAAHALLDEIAKGSPLALRLTKLAVDAPAAAHPQLDLVSQAVLFEDEEKHRRMTEFLERRRPR